MATTNGITAIERAEQVRHLAAAIFAESFGMDWTTAIYQASNQVDELLAFGAAWDAGAEQLQARATSEAEDLELDEAERTLEHCGRCGETLPAVEMEQGCPACHAAVMHTDRAALEAAVYVPSALDPHEQRAVDKAIFEIARGIVPQHVGRFWFVPSRTTGGAVYRVTLDSCTCEAGQHGRLCWHRALIGLEHELAA